MALNFLLLIIGGVISLAVVIGLIGFVLYSRKKEKEKEERWR